MKFHQVVIQKAHSGLVLLGRAGKTFRRDGFRAAIRLLWTSLYGFMPWRWKRDQQSEFDRQFGVDTSGIVRIASMEIDSPNYIHARYYKATSVELFVSLMQRLEIDPREYVFIDYGSGKGLTLLLASHYPFERIIGVEFGADLVRTAQENAARYRSPLQKCANIESVCLDAAAFEPPDRPLVIYCYDPFGLPVLRSVLEKLASSYQRLPRPILFTFHGAPPSSSLYEEAAARKLLFESYPFLSESRNNGTVVSYETPEVRSKVRT